VSHKDRSITHVVAPSIAAAALLAGAILPPVLAHDEDWRKLADVPEPVKAPGVTGASPRHLFESAESQFPQNGLYLRSWITPGEFPGNSGGVSDCWGYRSPSGREYAIVGLGNGFGFVEITDPSNPVILPSVFGAESLWHDVKVLGEYAYGVSEGGKGIQVIDLTQIDDGIVTLVQNKTQAGHSTTHNIAANTDSGYLYLCGANIANGGLVAVSTDDPANPTIAGLWGGSYVHDAQVVTYTEGPCAGKEIAYCFTGGNIRVLDVTDKDDMKKIGEVDYENSGYTHQGWLSEDRQYLYINDELDEITNQVSVTTTRVFDVADPANPTFLNAFTSGSTSIDHNLYTHNGFIFQANYLSGVRVFRTDDDPVDPPQVAWFDTAPGSDEKKFGGVWSVYPYLSDNVVIASDMAGGLFVLELDLNKLDLEPVNLAGEIVPPGQPFTIEIDVVEDGTQLVEGTVFMHYTLEDGDVASLPMQELEPGRFAADLPAAQCFSDLEYWFTADATSGHTFSLPHAAPFDTFSTYVASGTQSLVSIDFENVYDAIQWTAGGTKAAGQWELADPQGTSCQPEDDATEDGTLCYVTGALAGDTVESYDVDGVETLTSPVFDLAGLNDPRVEYQRWYCNASGLGTATDEFLTEISPDGGDTWILVEEFGPSGEGTKGGWNPVQIVIRDFIQPTSEVRFRFTAKDDDMFSSTVEAAIDDFSITEGLCDEPSCPADFNADGDLDVLDFLAFQTAFGSGDPAADFNADGHLDVLDFLAFQAAFTAGCP